MKKVLYITSTLPALTVTFIYKEVYRLRAMGMPVDTVSMNTPREDEVSSGAKDLFETTHYLDKQSAVRKTVLALATMLRHPIRTAKAIRHLFSAHPVKVPRDYFRLAYHLFEAAYLALYLKGNRPDHIHCHFINGPTSIGMFLSIFLNVPYSFTMHASMIWLDPVAFANKLATCSFCVSISEYNKKYVLETYGNQYDSKINIIHCGVDPRMKNSTVESEMADNVIQFLGVGQLNRRKGFHVLIPALRILKDRGLRFECTIVGDGEQRQVIADLIESNEVGDYVKLAGALLHEDVERCLSKTDVFVLPCVISEDGWRDGIPVALMEAMYFEIPVVSTNILGLPELIENEVGGLLVPAGDEDALADALERLARDANLRSRLGEGGRLKVIKEFNNDLSATTLKDLFEAC